MAGLAVVWAWGGGDKRLEGGVQVGDRGRQDREVAGAGRTVGVTLREVGSHRECAEEGYGRAQVFPSSLWLPSGEQILGGLWWTLGRGQLC